MSVTVLGGTLPRRGNALTRGFARLVLRLLGWRLEIEAPAVSRAIVIIAPHTSGWDFVFGMAAILALGLDVRWLGKHSLFRWPFDGFFRWFGGIPIDREHPQGAMVQIVHAFRQREQLVLALAPEGTRKRVDRWKRGFYVIAAHTGAPIIPAYIDYQRRIVGIHPAIHPTGDEGRDIGRLRELYREVRPRQPQLWNPDWH
jgi:1-acyl-sn-glycerol-3-phosphate acyltransferase